MAVDNIGATVSVGDLCLLAGTVRHVDGSTLLVTSADGKHAFRVKSTDTRKVDTVVAPSDLEAVSVVATGKQAANANLTALSGLTGAADKIPKFTGSGTMSLIDLSSLVQAAAGAFTTVPPTSAVAAASANDLVRKNEIDATITSLIIAIAGRLDATLVSAYILTLIGAADAAAARSTLGLGSLATQSVRSLDVCMLSIYVTGMAWTSMPSAHTLAFGASALGTIRRVDLTNYTQCRLRVVQANAAASGAKLRLRYATSFQTAASGYSAIGSGGTEVDVSLSTSTSQSLASSWFDLESAAKGDVWIACTGISGNGSTSPSFWSIAAEFR